MYRGTERRHSDRIRILIADEDTTFAGALARTLHDHDEFEVVGFARTRSEAELLIKELKPALLIAEADLCPGHRAGRRDDPAVVLLTGESGQADPRTYDAGVVACARRSDALSMIDVIVGFTRLSFGAP